MTWGRKTGGKDWKKGESFRSPGRTPLSPETKAIRKLTTDQFILRFNHLLKKSLKQLNALLLDSKTDILTVYLCMCLVRGQERGDYNTLNMMLDRIIGKVTLKIEQTGENGGPLEIRIIDVGSKGQ